MRINKYHILNLTTLIIVIGIVLAIILVKEGDPSMIKDKNGKEVRAGDRLYSEQSPKATVTVVQIDQKYGEDCLVLRWSISGREFRCTAKSLLTTKWVK